MSRNFNTHQSAAKFMSHGVQGPQAPLQQVANQTPPFKPQEQCNQEQQNPNTAEMVDVKMDIMQPENGGENPDMPPWKKKLVGVKKISNKERRRRQNQNLRRLVTPKSALMVLNEMVPAEQLTFKVGNVASATFYQSNSPSFSAEVTIGGCTYKGYGETKTGARSAAAEHAVRDIIIKKMVRALNQDHKSNEGKDDNGELPPDSNDEEPMPMIQLASFALHKLFTEWEGEGHHVPHLKPSNTSTSESGEAEKPSPKPPSTPKPKKAKVLPEKASSMHPCMLLTYMRPLQEYREMGVRGDRPQNLVYMMGVEVDGATYVGHGPNKKEARKQAAISACKALFNVTFD